MDPEIQCGNDLRFLEWWLIHHGKDPGYTQILKNLADVTQSAVQVLAAAQITNRAISTELRAESAKAFTAAAGKFAAAAPVAVAA